MTEILMNVKKEDLYSWISEGIGIFQLSKQPNELKIKNENPIISIPEKFRHIISQKSNLYLLIDEVNWISYASQENTHELASQLRNLGEGWLPIGFKPIDNNDDIYLATYIKPASSESNIENTNNNSAIVSDTLQLENNPSSGNNNPDLSNNTVDSKFSNISNDIIQNSPVLEENNNVNKIKTTPEATPASGENKIKKYKAKQNNSTNKENLEIVEQEKSTTPDQPILI